MPKQTSKKNEDNKQVQEPRKQGGLKPNQVGLRPVNSSYNNIQGLYQNQSEGKKQISKDPSFTGQEK